jgi:hypothetical protein
MSLTPQITLTATLEDFTSAAAGSTANPALLRISLCGFGAQIPCVAGTAVIARPGPFDIYSTGSPISQTIFGNDVITPAGTFYTIEVIDGDGNVVQCDAYIFNGTQTIDLSNATPILPGQPSNLPYLADEPCTGAVPGSVYTAPGPIVALFYNGMKLRPGASLPILGFSGVGTNSATLNFTTETGDWIDAICVV